MATDITLNGDPRVMEHFPSVLHAGRKRLMELS
jgi:hypothetical protein